MSAPITLSTGLITLTCGSTTLVLPDDLIWENEFGWAAVAQATERGIDGLLIVDAMARTGGRPITLKGTERSAWITRGDMKTLKTWAAIPGQQFDLTLRGEKFIVIFDHGTSEDTHAMALSAVFDFSDKTDSALYCNLMLRFLDMGSDTVLAPGGGTGTGAGGATAPSGQLLTTVPLPIANGRAALPALPLGALVWGMAQVYLDLQPADLLPSGALRHDRSYLVADYAGVTVTGATLMFNAADAADVNGKHAVVSYLA